ncbi:hypothetical protein [Chromobacterium phragmitis]|uniref:Peptidase C58 YopT-type domain-containing protein n=1 Tax=Chromobacterium phragmitis TaxID=2202141 RepID=A0ABV0IUK0_9NEIS
MAWSLHESFDNSGQGANAAGVCEAAVCLWLKHIQERVGKFNRGSSAGDFLPSTWDADALYRQFDSGAYLFRFVSYLERHILPSIAGHRHDADHQGGESFGVACSHYSANANGASAQDWQHIIEDIMAHGDALFLNLMRSGAASGHAVGVYKGSDYIWVFDPNHGLYRGYVSAGCCRSADIFRAAQYLAGLTGHWDQTVYFGLHMRAPKG